MVEEEKCNVGLLREAGVFAQFACCPDAPAKGDAAQADTDEREIVDISTDVGAPANLREARLQRDGYA